MLGGIIAGVGALAGGILGANASSHAADASAAASRQAADVQLEMYNRTREDLAPQREAQRYALDALLSMTGLPGLSPVAPAPRAAPVVRPGFLSTLTGSARNTPFGRLSQYRDDYSLGDLARIDYENYPGLVNYLDAEGIYGVPNGDMADAPRANLLPPEPRMLGGPIRQGRRYTVSELGHPEGIYNSAGTLQSISTTPQTITAPTNGYIAPMGVTNAEGEVLGGDGPDPFDPHAPTSPVAPVNHLPGTPPPTAPTVPAAPTAPPYLQTLGTPIPGSAVTENPGGQAGRYNFMTDPGYGFRFDEGLRAIERSGAARGMGLSGGILKALTRYGQGTASAEYGNVYNRIANIAGLGQTGQNLTAQAGMNAANQQANYLQNMGDANAAGALGRASAYGDTLEQLSRIYGQYWGDKP